jgi:phage FluMu protein Com
MSKLIRCPSCGGRKQLYGAGMIYKDCQKCGAVGFINEEIPVEEVKVEADETIKKEPKKKQKEVVNA